MGASSLVVIDIRREDAAQMALVEDHDVIQTLAANRAYNSLDESVLQGDRGAQTTSVIPIASTRLRKYEPYDPSRSRSRSAERCPTGTLRLPGARARLRSDAP